MAKLKQACCKSRENFEVLKRSYIQIYPADFLLCYVKAIDL